MAARIVWGAAAVAVLVALAGCGEKPTVTVYKQGKYQGKPDNVPWQSPPFNDNRADWERTIKARNNNQNEYARIGDQ